MTLELGTVPDWLAIVVTLATATGGGVLAGSYRAAVAHFHLEDRRKVLDASTSFVGPIDAMRSELPPSAVISDEIPMGVVSARGVIAAGEGLEVVEQLLGRLTWVDRAAWQRVFATVPRRWHASFRLVNDLRRSIAVMDLDEKSTTTARVESGLIKSRLPLFDGDEVASFTWVSDLHDELERFRRVEMYLINPSRWARLRYWRLKCGLVVWWLGVGRRGIGRPRSSFELMAEE